MSATLNCWILSTSIGSNNFVPVDITKVLLNPADFTYFDKSLNILLIGKNSTPVNSAMDINGNDFIANLHQSQYFCKLTEDYFMDFIQYYNQDNFSIEEKVLFNNLTTQKDFFKDYIIYIDILDKKYQEFDRSGKNFASNPSSFTGISLVNKNSIFSFVLSIVSITFSPIISFALSKLSLALASMFFNNFINFSFSSATAGCGTL